MALVCFERCRAGFRSILPGEKWLCLYLLCQHRNHALEMREREGVGLDQHSTTLRHSQASPITNSQNAYSQTGCLNLLCFPKPLSHPDTTFKGHGQEKENCVRCVQGQEAGCLPHMGRPGRLRSSDKRIQRCILPRLF